MEPAHFAARISPLISDLVFSVHRKARHDFVEPLVAAEEELGVTVRGLVGNITDVALSDRMTERDVLLRGRYGPEGAVLGNLRDLEAGGHLVRDGGVLKPSPGLRHVLEIAEDARARAAASLWTDAQADRAGGIIPAILAAAKVTDGLLASQLKAPEWTQPAHRLFQRLSRMRYLRNDSHAAAWAVHGMTAAEMVILTALWRDQELRDDPAALESLRNRGLADDGGITDKGSLLRQQIEDETNNLDAVAYATVDVVKRVGWLETLEQLPRFEA